MKRVVKLFVKPSVNLSVKLLIVLLLCILLSSSDTQYKKVIQYHLNTATEVLPLNYYWRGVQQLVPGAKENLTSIALQRNDSFWLDKLVSTDNGETAWRRYQIAKTERLERKWLKIAAQQGLAKAQLRYSLIQFDSQEKEKWLVKAANQEYQDAQLALADWYLLNEQFDLAMPWLEKVADFDPTSQVALANLLWLQLKRERSENLFHLASEKGNEDAKKRVFILDTYPLYVANKLSALPVPSFNTQCLQNILVVADGLEPMVNAHAIVDSFESDSRFDGMGVCLSKPVWLDNLLECSDNWQGNRRLGCNLEHIATWIKKSKASHVVVVGHRGKANVQNGVMYIDVLDSYNVFVHELAHFAGFVDEYPLGQSAANAYCGNIRATNLLFDDDDGFLLSLRPERQLALWETLPQFSGLYKAATCNKSDTQALKPSPNITFMEHHDSGTLPALYLYLWRRVLQSQQGTRPVLRYLSTNNAVAPHTATGMTTKLTNGINEATLTHIPKDTFFTRSSLSN